MGQTGHLSVYLWFDITKSAPSSGAQAMFCTSSALNVVSSLDLSGSRHRPIKCLLWRRTYEYDQCLMTSGWCLFDWECVIYIFWENGGLNGSQIDTAEIAEKWLNLKTFIFLHPGINPEWLLLFNWGAHKWYIILLSPEQNIYSSLLWWPFSHQQGI